MPSTRPNILLIVIDCLRADRSFDVDRTAQTPGMQALAERGTLFTHLITANSMTIPCMTTMFSGMYPAHHGVRAMVGARVSDSVPLLAELLRENGYHTYAEATGPLSEFYRLNRGFAETTEAFTREVERVLPPESRLRPLRVSRRCEIAYAGRMGRSAH